MSRSTFYDDEPELDSDEMEVIEAFAREYEDRREAYDRIVCSGKSERGTAIPVTQDEFQKIGHNAIRVREEILLRAREKGVTWRQIMDAKKALRG